MKVAAMISGGKDSTYNMMQCIAAGHQIVALANLYPEKETEIDSYMYQSVGFEAIDLLATAMDLPLFKKPTLGKSKKIGKDYVETHNDEVEDLFDLLKNVKEKMNIEGVSVGAILSDYQRVRVENVCIRLGLVPLAYLWQRNQKELLDEMINCEVDAILIKVAALGLDPTKHLGRSLSSIQSHLHNMHEKYGLNICGEGGEYETLTLDCPLFKSRLVIVESELVLHSNDPFATVGFLKLKKLALENKLPVLNLHNRLQGLPLRDSDGYVTDQGEDIKELNEDDIDCVEAKETMDKYQNSMGKQNFTVQKNASGWLWVGGIRGDDVDNPMEKAMSNLKSCLLNHNQDLSNVCSISMYIADMKNFMKLNQSYVKYFNFPNPPTRACVEVPLNEECPLILEAISWKLPEDTPCDPPVERHTIHVQSRSHWAPANIGPYSQVIKVGETTHLAGQIGLVPGSLELVSGGVKSQGRLALRHVERLLKAADPNANLRDVVQGVCYVKNLASVQLVRKLWEENTNNAIVDYVVVSELPKGALVEWHVWAHRFNHVFEYEETGRCIENDNWSISIFRRWNDENKIAAIISYLEKTNPNEDATFDKKIFVETVNYTLQKLKQGHTQTSDNVPVFSIKIFYPVSNITNFDENHDYLDGLKKDISFTYTFVPVIYCKNENTYLSIYGTRSE